MSEQDIVQRLRRMELGTCDAGADEIERLQRENADLRSILERTRMTIADCVCRINGAVFDLGLPRVETKGGGA